MTDYRFRDVQSGQGPVNIGQGNRAAGRDYRDNRSYHHVDNRGGQYAGRDFHDRRAYVRQGDNYDVQVGPSDAFDAIASGRGIGRLLAAIGTIVALAGFVAIGYLIVSNMTGDLDPSQNPFTARFPDGWPIIGGSMTLPVGAGAFLGGAILAGIGASMAKAARRRHDRRMRQQRGYY